MSKKSGLGKLFAGVAIGTGLGLLFATKTGEETRKDLKKLAEEYQSKAMSMYNATKKILEKKLDNLKKAGAKLDESKYMDLVNEVVEEVKKDGSVTAEAAKGLGTQLKKDWEMVKMEFNK